MTKEVFLKGTKRRTVWLCIMEGVHWGGLTKRLVGKVAVQQRIHQENKPREIYQHP